MCHASVRPAFTPLLSEKYFAWLQARAEKRREKKKAKKAERKASQHKQEPDPKPAEPQQQAAGAAPDKVCRVKYQYTFPNVLHANVAGGGGESLEGHYGFRVDFCGLMVVFAAIAVQRNLCGVFAW
jgi:hypothetical protein